MVDLEEGLSVEDDAELLCTRAFIWSSKRRVAKSRRGWGWFVEQFAAPFRPPAQHSR
jgi:hypothetical protein